MFIKLPAISNLYNKGQEERENQSRSPELNVRKAEECWQGGRRVPAAQQEIAEKLQLLVSKAVLIIRNTQSTWRHRRCKGHRRVYRMTRAFNRAYPDNVLKNERKSRGWGGQLTVRAPRLCFLLCRSWDPASLRARAEELSTKEYVPRRAAQPHRPHAMPQGWSAKAQIKAWKHFLGRGEPHQMYGTFL